MDDLKEFQFSYRFNGKRWSVNIFARDAHEAKQKILAMAQAEFDGEILAQFYVPKQLGILRRWLQWLKR